MPVQLNISAGYLSDFECPLGVSAMSKLALWPTLQKLGFAGSLTYLNQNFHGLGDFNTQLLMYSSTNSILESAWSTIQQIAPKNPQVTVLMYMDPSLGLVGKEFQNLTGFGQAFAITPDQLKQPTNIPSLVSSGATVPQSAAFSTVGV